MQLPEIDPRQRARPRVLPAEAKLLAAVCLITFTALLPRRVLPVYLLPAGVLLVLWIGCRMPVAYALRRLIVVEFFILAMALMWLVSPASEPVVLSAILKSNLCVLAMVLLTWTTPFQDLLQALRRLRLPAVMLTTLALMYRYLPVVAEESRRMQRARSARRFSHRRRLGWEALTTIIGQLFIRSADRAERIYLAMCARGWK